MRQKPLEDHQVQALANEMYVFVPDAPASGSLSSRIETFGKFFQIRCVKQPLERCDLYTCQVRRRNEGSSSALRGAKASAARLLLAALATSMAFLEERRMSENLPAFGVSPYLSLDVLQNV
ncbi:MAG: hypothetical protein ABSE73_00905 [Planctomycetota bacterium]